MKTIWEWNLEPYGATVLSLPKKTEVLSVQLRKGRFVLWGISTGTPLGDPVEERVFCVYATREPILGNPGQHIVTIQGNDDMVWHIFEDLEWRTRNGGLEWRAGAGE